VGNAHGITHKELYRGMSWRCLGDIAGSFPLYSPITHISILKFYQASLINSMTQQHSTIELMTVIEAAEFLKVSVATMRRLQQARAIPFFKVGGSVRFSKEDILTYIEKQRITAIVR
jgi:excisionase family DNA binding protein